jgi:hypothetical protein
MEGGVATSLELVKQMVLSATTHYIQHYGTAIPHRHISTTIGQDTLSSRIPPMEAAFTNIVRGPDHRGPQNDHHILQKSA